MIRLPDFDGLRPPQRAELIYAQARSDLSNRLWRAALGSEGEVETPSLGVPSSAMPQDLNALLAMVIDTRRSHGAAPLRQVLGLAPVIDGAASVPIEPATRSTNLALGVNGALAPAIEQAAARTGLPAPALAAIINAEAAKRPDGSWQTMSRNPRSSAAGLGQFLSGTWLGEAQRKGTWLNATARSRGWVSENGRVDPAAKSSLLAMRYDPEASINATADFARANLDRLRKAGVDVGQELGAVARAAYLGHHLGAGDAVRFLKGGLETGRARMLLNAQVGVAAANVRIARAGDAAAAHRNWLLDYVGNRVQPRRFAAAQMA